MFIKWVYRRPVLHSKFRSKAIYVKVVRYGRSRSSKVIEIAQADLCELPSVAKYKSYLRRLQDIATQRSEICVLRRFYPPESRLKPSQVVFFCDLGYESWSYNTRVPGLPTVIMTIQSHPSSSDGDHDDCFHLVYRLATDRRTDRQTDGTACSYVAL